MKIIVVDDYSPYASENIKLLDKTSINYEYWTINMQINFFKDNFGSEWEKYWLTIPHKSDACRSFGYLIAGLWDADVIITLDDDNWPINEDKRKEYSYLKGHDVVNTTFKGLKVRSSNGWFNTISMLKTHPSKNLFARGYPYATRGDNVKYTYSKAEEFILMNVGLWTGNPDVDSITVLNEYSLNGLPKTKCLGLKRSTSFILDRGTFAPLNTANTAYSRRILPVIYDTFQGAAIGELKLDRFGDIWCNLFVKKILDRVGGGIAVGLPLVEHKREPRNTFEDLKKELWGIIVSEKLFRIIQEIDLYSQSYLDAYKELIEGLQKRIHELVEDPLKKYFNRLFESMYRWIIIVDELHIL